jgi:restriction system protein
MATPKYDELAWPLLELLKDGQPRSAHEAAAALSNRFDLTDEERSALLPSGVQTYMLNRTGWAGFYRAGLLTRMLFSSRVRL